MMKQSAKCLTAVFLAAGLAAAEAKVTPVAVTNSVALENISVSLKVYSQGLLGGSGKTAPTTLKANVSSLATSDILQQLVGITSNAFTYSKSDKLVRAHFYSNVLIGTPGTVMTYFTTNVSLTGGTNLFVETASGLQEFTPLYNAGQGETNTLLITNDVPEIVAVTSSSTNVTSTLRTLTNAQLLLSADGSNFTVLATLNTNYITTTNLGQILGFTTTVVPTITTNGTNLTVTTVGPDVESVYTNRVSDICVYIPKSGSTPAELISVSNWIRLSTSGTMIYSETGEFLTGNAFSGTNITKETVAGDAVFTVTIAYPTNGQPANYTNIDFSASGFGMQSYNLLNLTVSGTNKNEEQIISSGSAVLTGTGFVGGTFTTNTTQINTFNGVTTTNATVPVSVYLGTNLILGGRVEDETNVLVDGTLTTSLLLVATNIPVLQP